MIDKWKTQKSKKRDEANSKLHLSQSLSLTPVMHQSANLGLAKIAVMPTCLRGFQLPLIEEDLKLVGN